MRRLFVRLLMAAVFGLLLVKLAMGIASIRFGNASDRAFRQRLHEQKVELALSTLNDIAPAQRGEGVRELRANLRLGLHAEPGWVPRDARMYSLEDGTRVGVLPVLTGPRRPHWGPLAVEMTLSLGVWVLLLWGLGRPVVRDLERVEDVATRFGGGDLSARTELTEGPIGRVGRQLDAMALQVETTMADQAQLLQAVSHEIRTPLARMRFQIEILRASNDHPTLNDLDEELGNVDDLVSDLLALQRLDRAPLEAPAPDETRTVLEGVKRQMDVLASVTIDLDMKGGLMVSPKDLQLVARNLVSNAIRHAKTRVLIRTLDGVLVVEDDGPGVPEDARQKVFQTFASLDPARSRQLGGVGLGLSLVRRAAERWGGTVTVDRGGLGGARFTVTFSGPAEPVA